MTAGTGDQRAAATAGRRHLRASRADREQVIGVLKAAFVQGRLTKDEFDLRVGQTFTARSYADLAAITADLPAGLTDIQPPRQPARPPMSKVVAVTALIMPPAMLAATFLTDNGLLMKMSHFVVFIYFVGWMVAGGVMLDSWLPMRSRWQLPPPTERGQALEGEQDAGTGADPMLYEARGMPMPVTCLGPVLSSASGGHCR